MEVILARRLVIQEIVGSVLKLLKLSAIAKNKLNKVSVGNNFPLAINLVIRLSHVAITNAFKTVIQDHVMSANLIQMKLILALVVKFHY